MQVSISFDITKGKKQLMKEFSSFVDGWENEGKSAATDTDEDAEEAPPKKKAAKKGKPSKTVSDDEDEDFGTKGAVDEDELEEDDADESDDDAEEDEDALPWETVKEAINKYGNKSPDAMKAILLSFNFKSTKELQQHKVKWEPVYRKVMAKLKATKKAK
jgi:hypothetical protein